MPFCTSFSLYHRLACLSLSCCLLFLACQQQEQTITPAFYHWKTKLALAEPTRNYMQQLAVQKLYLRCFDIDWDAQRQLALPLASLQAAPQDWAGLSIVPTIFITNRTFRQLPTEQIPQLAQRSLQKISTLQQTLAFPKLTEIQIDCDWTLSTKAAYFQFLEQLADLLEKQKIALSATIRLHQIKYFKKTGVPPVQRGMLMFYNTGDLDDPEAKNTILELSLAEKYLQHAEAYPLALDLALPLFAWGVVYRDHKMVQLINGLQAPQLKDTSRFLKLRENHFKVLESTYLNGDYLYQDDQIRLEQIAPETLLAAAQVLARRLRPTDRSISFYHLDSTIIKNYPHEILETVFHSFH